MESLKNWTDDELTQVYDLQKQYAEKVVDFVRHGEEEEVLKFLQILPELHDYADAGSPSHKIFIKENFEQENSGEEIPIGKYIYKDMFGHRKSADALSEIFEEKYLWDFEEARPKVLAIFADNEKVALENYSLNDYEKLKNKIPQTLKSEIKNLIEKYPKELEEKATQTAIYGYTNAISNVNLSRYRNEHMPEFEKIQWVVNQENLNTVVAAYDLQKSLEICQPYFKGKYVTEVIRNFALDDAKIFKFVYGERAEEVLNKSDEDTIRLASRYDFVNTEEKLPILENHKICLYGTAEQKLRIPYKEDNFCVSEKDLKIILDELATKYECEGFSKKYYADKVGNKNYYGQGYKVLGRANHYEDLQPEWNIMFADGKIVKARASEIISSAINERLYGEQFEKFGTRPLSEVLVSGDNEKLSLKEGKEKISAIIQQLERNGESVSKLKDFLEEELKSLSRAR